MQTVETPRRLPPWLRKKLAFGKEALRTDSILQERGLQTICQSGKCPNRNECYSQHTATFMIMGSRCTRSCRYCAVTTAKPEPLDTQEPEKIAEAVSLLGLEHAVITSVTRDDLVDEGVGHFTAVTLMLKQSNPHIILELLTPDFRRDQFKAVEIFGGLDFEIFNHNIETVKRLHHWARPQGGYDLSLDLLRRMAKAKPSCLIKSGAMLGLGETQDEVRSMMKDLRELGCQMLTLGQYLKSDPHGLDVKRFVEPREFDEYKEIGYDMGFWQVESGPFVRSSYHAKHSFEKIKEYISARSQ
jgi:lipoyl synthase